jgi:hypothetical protein
MPFTVQDEKQYPVNSTAVFQAALGAIEGLQGKILKQNPEAGTVEVHFDKKILGKVLGDRTQMKLNITAPDGDSSVVAVEIYPLNAVGQKLMFGARKGVSRTVADWFYAHLEHRLPK